MLCHVAATRQWLSGYWSVAKLLSRSSDTQQQPFLLQNNLKVFLYVNRPSDNCRTEKKTVEILTHDEKEGSVHFKVIRFLYKSAFKVLLFAPCTIQEFLISMNMCANMRNTLHACFQMHLEWFSPLLCDLFFSPEAFWSAGEKPIYYKCHTNMGGNSSSKKIEGFFLSAKIKNKK